MSAPQPVMPTDSVPKPNYLAIGSFIAGLLATLSTLGNQPTPALICGIIAIGRTWAILGIVLGAVPLVFLLFVLVR